MYVRDYLVTMEYKIIKQFRRKNVICKSPLEEELLKYFTVGLYSFQSIAKATHLSPQYVGQKARSWGFRRVYHYEYLTVKVFKKFSLSQIKNMFNVSETWIRERAAELKVTIKS